MNCGGKPATSSSTPYRPWTEALSASQGELQCLAENDLHNGLMFIESAVGVLRLRDIYREAGIPCASQQRGGTDLGQTGPAGAGR